jgi:hypothetical protein
MFLADSPIVEFMGFPNAADLIFLPILLHPMSRGFSVSGVCIVAFSPVTHRCLAAHRFYQCVGRTRI